MMGGPHPQQAAVMQAGTLPTVLQTDGGFDINSIMNLMLMMMVMVMMMKMMTKATSKI